ncbi:MAG: hypothetical protein OIF51_03575 [Cellvibrionaceae bacterium]|nr:hypothetical protein [Cellvibrionaceae bacterium]
MKKATLVTTAILALGLSATSFAGEVKGSEETICKKASSSIHQKPSRKCMTESEWKVWTAKAEKQKKRQLQLAEAGGSKYYPKKANNLQEQKRQLAKVQ